MEYLIPQIEPMPKAQPNHLYMVASGDLRLSANKTCWPAQSKMEEKIRIAFQKEGKIVVRAHPFDASVGHGFIWNQRMGMDIFRSIPPEAPIIIPIAVWQYSYHLLAGLRDHTGPILTIANWSGQWPGLVGMLNLNACLTKMGISYSTIWSEDFTDDYFTSKIRQWLKEGRITHDTSHVRDLNISKLPSGARALGIALAKQLKNDKAIIGVFDEGCMGMYNAIIDDELLNACGIYKERLSQSALLAEMRLVSDAEALAIKNWLINAGMTFKIGKDETTELTENQIIEQLKMYIAAVRIADFFSCDAIGIQYQQGLKDMAPASDLAEGLLNNTLRPPVVHRKTGKELYEGKALPHFNEVDECSAVDAIVTNRVMTAMRLDPATTLHDVRWGARYSDNFIWVFQISGAVPPSHIINGYAGAISVRQPAMYFPKGGGTIKGECKPGEIVWSRVFVVDAKELHVDIGRGTAVHLPSEETNFRWKSTTEEWPIMNTILHGVNRDQLMARHRSNHIQVVYAPSEEIADEVLAAKAAMFSEMGITVHICGDVKVG